MKRIRSIILVMVCTVLMFSSCVKKTQYYTFETDLGDTFCLEVYMSGNLKGMFPKYLLYEAYEGIEKKTGSVLYVDRTNEGQMPDDPISNITSIGTYGDHNFYKIFDTLFYCRKGVYMDSISKNFDVDYYEYKKKSPQLSGIIIHCVEAISDLMKSQKFEYIYKFGEILASDKDPELQEMLIRYANGYFTDEEKQINAASSITEADMIVFAQSMLEKYYAE